MKDLMKRHLYLIAPIVFAAVISLVAPVSATAGDPDITLGIGAAFVPDYEGSTHYEARPLPFANVVWDSGRFLKLDGNGLRANVIANDTWSFGPLVQYRDKRSDVDNGQVDDMRKVDPASEVGAFVGMNVDNWKAELCGTKDIAAGHHGYLVSLSGGYTMPVDESLKIYMGASTTYASGEYMSTYFKVDRDNSMRSGLKTYSADSGFKDIGVNMNVRYSPWEKWGIMCVAGYKRLIGDAEDSPVVDDAGDANQYSGGIIATYNF